MNLQWLSNLSSLLHMQFDCHSRGIYIRNSASNGRPSLGHEVEAGLGRWCDQPTYLAPFFLCK